MLRLCISSWLLLSIFSLLSISAQTQELKRVKRPRPRIVGGIKAGKFLASHLANVIVSYSDSSYTGLCTATVLAPRWLLTAAHCLVGPGGKITGVPKSTYAFIGAQDAALRVHNTDKAPAWLRSYFIHRDYKPGSGDHRNDIAMLFLDDVIAPGTYRTVNLSSALPPYGITVSAAGYGTLGEHAPRAKNLMKTNLLLKPFAICAEREHFFTQQYLSSDAQLCAVSHGWPKRGSTDTCYGDSGGPVFLLDSITNKIQQYGITSFGTSTCAAPGSVAWYTRVGTYAKAVRMMIRGNSTFWKEFS